MTARRAWWSACIAALFTWVVLGTAFARGPVPPDAIAAGKLPPEALETLRLIRAGGPFPYAKDGTIFSNRERLLPPRPRGYYREYTVRTPGSRDRGPRRIVAGAAREYYWTADHYATFRRITEVP